MVLNKINEMEYHVAKNLAVHWDKNSLAKMKKKNTDRVYIVSGRERCQPKGNKILMADGSWKDISEMVIGDLIISPQEDNITCFAKVTKTFKYSNCRIYSVSELNKNKKELYTCSGQHCIPTYKKVDKKRIKGDYNKREPGHWEFFNFPAEYCSNFSVRMKKNTTTMLSPPIEKYYGRENCLIEPYTLGVWLGDGHWHTCIGITSNTPEILAEIEKSYKVGNIANKKGTSCKTYIFHRETGLKQQLAHYGLANTKSGTKFIPKQAMLSDLFYRQKLLAGLIDSDGYYKGGGYDITTKSERLAKDILELVRSIGGVGNICKVKKGIKKLNFIGTYFKVSFRCPDVPIIVEKKKRTGNKWYLSTNRCSVDVRPTKEFDNVYGIEIDSSSQLYITNNYVVTHNSGKSTFAIQQMGYLEPDLFKDPAKVAERIVFSPEQFDKVVRDTENGVIIFDEAFRGFSSRAALSKVNKQLITTLMEMGQNNNMVFIVLPSFFMLDTYPAMLRSHGLFNITEDNRTNLRAWHGYSNRDKNKVYQAGVRKGWGFNIKTRFRGRFGSKFPGGEEFEKAYLKKKKDAFNDIKAELKMEEDKPVYLKEALIMGALKNRGIEEFKTWKKCSDFLEKECQIKKSPNRLNEVFLEYRRMVENTPKTC